MEREFVADCMYVGNSHTWMLGVRLAEMGRLGERDINGAGAAFFGVTAKADKPLHTLNQALSGRYTRYLDIKDGQTEFVSEFSSEGLWRKQYELVNQAKDSPSHEEWWKLRGHLNIEDTLADTVKNQAWLRKGLYSDIAKLPEFESDFMAQVGRGSKEFIEARLQALQGKRLYAGLLSLAITRFDACFPPYEDNEIRAGGAIEESAW